MVSFCSWAARPEPEASAAPYDTHSGLLDPSTGAGLSQ